MHYSLQTNFFKNLKTKSILFKYIQQCHCTDTRQSHTRAALTENEVPLQRLIGSALGHPPQHLWKGHWVPKALLHLPSAEHQVHISKEHNSYIIQGSKCISWEQEKKYMHWKILFKNLTRFHKYFNSLIAIKCMYHKIHPHKSVQVNSFQETYWAVQPSTLSSHPCPQHSHIPSPQATPNPLSVSVDWLLLGISQKWDHTLCGRLWQASFISGSKRILKKLETLMGPSVRSFHCQVFLEHLVWVKQMPYGSQWDGAGGGVGGGFQVWILPSRSLLKRKDANIR